MWPGKQSLWLCETEEKQSQMLWKLTLLGYKLCLQMASIAQTISKHSFGITLFFKLNQSGMKTSWDGTYNILKCFTMVKDRFFFPWKVQWFIIFNDYLFYYYILYLINIDQLMLVKHPNYYMTKHKTQSSCRQLVSLAYWKQPDCVLISHFILFYLCKTTGNLVSQNVNMYLAI